MTDTPPYRSGFVAVVGRPNVGKSTLLNAALRQKVAGVSPWPQTTRRRQLGILTLPGAQVVFMDTPGLHQPKNRLGKAMIRIAEETLDQADVVLYLADLEQPAADEEREFGRWVEEHEHGKPVLLALNKSDKVPDALRSEREASYRAMFPGVECLVLSAVKGEGVGELLSSIISRLPEGPALYPEEEVTDLSEREIAADLIREAALANLRAEVPHGTAVRIDEFSEREGGGAFIRATLFVEKESHKGIVIGRGGAMLKTIGSLARGRIEEMSGRRVYLELRVKVLPGWRNHEDALKRFGYWPKKD
jgi:GTP-binding protein Era